MLSAKTSAAQLSGTNEVQMHVIVPGWKLLPYTPNTINEFGEFLHATREENVSFTEYHGVRVLDDDSTVYAATFDYDERPLRPAFTTYLGDRLELEYSVGHYQDFRKSTSTWQFHRTSKSGSGTRTSNGINGDWHSFYPALLAVKQGAVLSSTQPVTCRILPFLKKDAFWYVDHYRYVMPPSYEVLTAHLCTMSDFYLMQGKIL